ncbi:MAG: cache domain-containing protein [Oligoflexia bacterium]|nr:cache domain-containing protein [Oligoflexia bacterium]MBF0364071.1 cache domain-containing protein [Oligoflexia bacterium]
MLKTTLTMFLLLSLLCPSILFGEDSCTESKTKAVCKKELVQKQVEDACELLIKEGKAALPKIKSLRYDCCGEPNYIWINDLVPNMIMHPIKPQLDGKNISDNQDPDGVRLFVEMVKATESKAEGAWVNYRWTKFGESDPTPKISFVKRCSVSGTKDTWIAGSGTWK